MGGGFPDISYARSSVGPRIIATPLLARPLDASLSSYRVAAGGALGSLWKMSRVSTSL